MQPIETFVWTDVMYGLSRSLRYMEQVGGRMCGERKVTQVSCTLIIKIHIRRNASAF